MQDTVCRLCDGPSPHIGQSNNFPVYRCSHCGFLFAEGDFFSMSPEDIYDNYGGNDEYLAKKDKKLKRSGRRIARYKSWTNGRRFLEIGCNVGIATEAARLQGFEASGIDVDNVAIRVAEREFPQCAFANESIEKRADTGQQYDFMFCSEVIEHVPDPRSFLTSMKKLLAPGGVIWLSTPNAGHWRVPSNPLEWKELIPPFHIGMFSAENMREALRCVGLKVAKQEFNLKWGLKVVIRHIDEA